MDTQQLIEILTKEFDVELKPATRTQWRNKDKEVTPTILRNAIKATVKQAIKPIAEFHKLNLKHGKNVDSFTNRIADEGVKKKLQNAAGIYGFYDGVGELIYVGKTEKNTLFNEMSQRYGNKEVSFRVIKDGKAIWELAYLKHVSVYFSAYKVNPNLIKNTEALLTRIVLNNASNLKVESFMS